MERLRWKRSERKKKGMGMGSQDVFVTEKKLQPIKQGVWVGDWRE